VDFHPDDWNDVLVYLIVGIPAIIAALMGFKHQNKAIGKSNTMAAQTLDQVKNDHDSNLRDDIDALGEIHIDISGIREELRTERIERIEGDRRHG
jgi:hypothetical protein